MTRAFFVLLADLTAFLIVTYLIGSLASTPMTVLANWPDPERWIAIFVVGAVSITCVIKIGPLSRLLVDLIRMPFDRSKG